MNRVYRNDFRSRVDAEKTILDPRYGREKLISHHAFKRFDAEAKANLASGEIDQMDYINLRSYIGYAVNGPRAGA